MSKSRSFYLANMYFTAVCENKIIAKIPEFLEKDIFGSLSTFSRVNSIVDI